MSDDLEQVHSFKTNIADYAEISISVNVSVRSRLASHAADVNLATYRAINFLRDELNKLSKEIKEQTK